MQCHVIVRVFRAWEVDLAVFSFVRYYVDDGNLVEAQWFRDGRRCMHALQSLSSDRFRLMENGSQRSTIAIRAKNY